MSNFKDLRIVDNFYQTSLFFPMPTVLIGTLTEDGKVTKTDGGIVDESIKHIPPDVNGKEHFLFYIKNNPIDFEKQMIRFEFTPLADNMGESKAKLHIYYGTLDKPIVDNSDYDRWLIFTDKQ